MHASSPATVGHVARVIEQWAPPGAALSYDNVGLQVGAAEAPVSRALVCLDATPAVAEEAAGVGAELIVAHHPLLFRPLRQLTDAEAPSALALRLAREGIALYVAHTNLDLAPGGVSYALADALGLEDARLLQPLADAVRKLVTFVPRTHLEAVRLALAGAGAGRIGAYEACAFVGEGAGYFTPGADAAPFLGTAGGGPETAAEARLEVLVDRWQLPAVLGALRAAHPYEEPAWDVYPVGQPHTRFGLGVVGRLPEPMPLSGFLDHVCARLHTPAVRYSGPLGRPVARVAVAGGSASELLPDAVRAGADAFVTADVKYHAYFDALDPRGAARIAFIDAGHFETEQFIVGRIVERLRAHLPGGDWRAFSGVTSAMQVHVRR